MSMKAARDALVDATQRGISPTIEALDELLDEIDDFFTFVEDYDEWEMMCERWIETEDGPQLDAQPGFSLEKLRTRLGFNKDGTE